MQLLRQYLAFVLIIFSITVASAQDPVSKQGTISYLNAQLEASDSLWLKGKSLMINSFRESELVKEDKINIYDLNPKSVVYSTEEKLVVVKCTKDADGCVERKTMKVSRKAYRNRVTFSVTSPDHGEKVVKALHHLINLHIDKKYQGLTSFE